MASKRYTQFGQLKRTDNAPRPSPGVGRGPGNYDGYSDKTAGWPGAPGPKGPKRNTLGWPEIPQAAKQDMPDDGRVGKKIKKLMHEGKPQKQAVAAALEMKRQHKLGPKGGYRR